MNKDNLLKLRDGLAALPDDYQHFGMGLYYGNLTPPEVGTVAPSACGSVACAVGHAPSMVEPPIALENWRCYCLRVFGMQQDSIDWIWLFSPNWSDHDNTVAGAVSRIDYYLAHGVPKEFSGLSPYEDGLAIYQNSTKGHAK